MEATVRELWDAALAFSAYRRTFKNYRSVIFHMKTRQYPLVGVVRQTGRTILIPSHYFAFQVARGLLDADYHSENDLVSVNLNGRPYFFSGATENGDLVGVFSRREYSRLEVSGLNVVDVGANIGDSAIYFAAMGAKHVYALEPFPSSFEFARKNIQINDLEEKITIINAGVSDADGKIAIDPAFENTPMHQMRSSQSGIRVPILSLGTLMANYGINDAVLKMDCEGFEYPSILSSSPELLRRFRRVQIEYHYGPDKLVDKLRNSGFSVSFTRERSSFNKHVAKPHMSVGYIFGTRNTSN
jgi:FkbM family methyltransferase